MTAKNFVAKAKDIAKNYKTLYVLGSFGSPMTTSNKKRFINKNDYNGSEARKKKINAATADTFGFDCSGLIKGILWGWSGDEKKTNGGATYGSKGVKDINADTMITSTYCDGVSTNFKNIKVGEILWTNGHVGIYMGSGLALEATSAWKSKVQITAVKNIGTKEGYKARTWKKHGKLKYIDYSTSTSTTTSTTTKVTYYPKCSSSHTSLVDALNSIKVDSSYANRTKIAAKNGIKSYRGNATQNTKLLDLLKDGKLIKA